MVMVEEWKLLILKFSLNTLLAIQPKMNTQNFVFYHNSIMATQPTQ